jgi:hypothetical protein
MAAARARVTKKPHSCRSPNQQANTKTRLATEPMTMDQTKSAVWRPSQFHRRRTGLAFTQRLRGLVVVDLVVHQFEIGASARPSLDDLIRPLQ